MVSIATPYPIFTAINFNIYRQGLDSASVHGVEKRHVLCASHPGAVEPGLFVILPWMRRLDVDIRAISYRNFLDCFNLLVGHTEITPNPSYRVCKKVCRICCGSILFFVQILFYFCCFFFCMKMSDDDYKTKGSKIKPKD